MSREQLLSLYRSLTPSVETLFVSPPVRFQHPDTDYLYRLYHSFLEKSDSPIQVRNVNKFQQYKFFWSQCLGRSPIVHYHWIEFQHLSSLIGVLWKLGWLILYKAVGGKIVWTFHNLEPHRGRYRYGNRLLFQWMIYLADRLHFHCRPALEQASTLYSIDVEKCVIIPHPEFTARPMERPAAIEQLRETYSLDLSPEDTILLSLGNIAAYKKLDELVPFVEEQLPHAKLIIAGNVRFGKDNHYRQLESLAADHNQVILIPEFIPDEQIPAFMNAADAAIFNHRQVLTSGGIELAKSYRKPVIAPATGCHAKEADLPGMHLFRNHHELTSILNDFGRN